MALTRTQPMSPTSLGTVMFLERTSRAVMNHGRIFDLQADDGGIIEADDVARMTASNLQDEFADVGMTADLI